MPATKFSKKTNLISEQNKTKVIINADDFGLTKGVNQAIIELADAGLITSTSVMSNMPHYKELIKIKENIGIGIHFNLTCGKPVLDAHKVPSIVNQFGDFYKLSELICSVRQGLVSKQDVEREFDAQVKQIFDIGIRPDHIDSHESLLKYPFFMQIMKKVAQKYELFSVRTYIPRTFDYSRLINPKKVIISFYLYLQRIQWQNAGFRVADKFDSLLKFGLDHGTAIYKLRNIFRNLPDGVLEVCVHPGYCNGNDALFGGYDQERKIEFSALFSDEFRKTILNSKVALISYKNI